MAQEAKHTPGLADRYDQIFDECMALAMSWRKKVDENFSDRPFYADQHKRSLLRAARFARMADVARPLVAKAEGR